MRSISPFSSFYDAETDTERALCVGGPKDGEFVAIEPNLIAGTLWYIDHPTPGTGIRTTVEYKVAKLGTKNYTILVHAATLSLHEVIERLLLTYAGIVAPK